PYNFYPVSSYSDQIRAVLKYLKDVAAQEGISKPKIVFLYPDHPYGRAPIPAGKAYAQELGFVVGTDQIVALAALEARSQVAAVKAFGADFAWIGGTTNSASVIVRDARAAGLTTRFAVNVWGFDENMIKLIGKDPDGLAPVVTLARDDHRPSTTTRIVTVRDGRITVVKSVTVERRKDWLGF